MTRQKSHDKAQCSLKECISHRVTNSSRRHDNASCVHEKQRLQMHAKPPTHLLHDGELRNELFL